MQKWRNLKHIFFVTLTTVCLIGVMSFFPSTTISLTQFFVYQSHPLLDALYVQKSTKSDEVVVIPIDTQMMNELQANNILGATDGSFRIPRSWYRDVIEMLQEAGVKAIGIDIVFQNRDEYEEEFADIMKKYDNIVIATIIGNTDQAGNCQMDKVGESKGVIVCENSPRSIFRDTTWGNVSSHPYAYVPTQKAPSYYQKSLGYSGEYIESFALAVYRKSQDITTIPTMGDRENYVVGMRNIPLNQNGEYLMPYFSKPKGYLLPEDLRRFGSKSKNQMGTGSAPPVGILAFKNNKAYTKKLFAGKIVLIGEDGTILHDEIESPVTRSMMPGVELHANMIDGLLQDKLLREYPTVFTLLTAAILTLFSIFLYFWVPKYVSIFVVFFSSIGWIILSRYLYDIERIVVHILPFLIAIIGGYIITFIYRFFVVDREQRKLQKNFGHYVDPHVVQRIVDQGERIQLGGEERDVTVLFSDIAGFTTIAEKLTPEKLFSLMTDYLSRMTDILTDQGGTLDKYIGDAVMGFFGAPLDLPDHPLRACETALLMRNALPGFNEHLKSQGLEPIDFRVGMATGRVMVGNIGSEDRFNYTVLGDTVNLASRLEATGKEYDVHIIIPESTREQIGERYIVRELDTIAVKGKTEGVRIYELIGTPDQVKSRYALEQYGRALALYREGKHKDAGILWEKQKDLDPPSRVMMQRCLSILQGETHVEGGIYHMTHK